jgi:UDP-N-acetylglucosamine enolpyruvyl transferase
MCLFLSTLLSKGKSVLEGAEQIERGYEKLVAKFTALGAKIKLDSNG